MFSWLRELLEIRRENQERKSVCNSCEILKMALAQSNIERSRLLNELLKQDDPLSIPPVSEPEKIQPKMIPWKVRQQQLEAEDREKAAEAREKTKVMAEFNNRLTEANKLNTSKLEESLGIDNSVEKPNAS